MRSEVKSTGSNNFEKIINMDYDYDHQPADPLPPSGFTVVKDSMFFKPYLIIKESKLFRKNCVGNVISDLWNHGLNYL